MNIIRNNMILKANYGKATFYLNNAIKIYFASQMRSKPVVIYGTEFCSYCNRAKNYLDAHQV